MTAFTLRLDDSLTRKLHQICQKRGYSKTGLIKSLIRNFVNWSDISVPNNLSPKNSLKSLVGIVRLGGDAIDDANSYFE